MSAEIRKILSICLLLIGASVHSSTALAYTANRVMFEYRPKGGYRVVVNYTVPSLREYREAYVDFKRKKEAEAFYWDMVRGADFYPSDPTKRQFLTTTAQSEPW